MKTPCFRWTSRVYYGDIDGQGVLYHAQCLNFFERARTEWVRSLGVRQSDLLAQGLGFVVSTATIDYRAPAFFEDFLITTVLLDECQKSFFSVSQQLLRPENTAAGSVKAEGAMPEQMGTIPEVPDGSKVLVEGAFRIVFVDMKRFKPVAMPQELSAVIRAELP